MKRIVLAAFAAYAVVSAGQVKSQDIPTAPASFSSPHGAIPTGVQGSTTQPQGRICVSESWAFGHVGNYSAIPLPCLGQGPSGPYSEWNRFGYYAFDNSGHYLGTIEDGGILGPGVTQAISTIPAAALAPGSAVSVQVSGLYPDPSSPGGFTYLNASVPLSAFFAQTSGSNSALTVRLDALDAAVAANSAQIAGLSARIDTYIAQQSYAAAQARRSQEQLTRGIALASSLSMLAPAAGRDNRLGFGMGTFAGETAMSVNYIRRSGDLDFGFAAALSGGDTLGKASLGVSW